MVTDKTVNTAKQCCHLYTNAAAHARSCTTRSLPLIFIFGSQEFLRFASGCRARYGMMKALKVTFAVGFFGILRANRLPVASSALALAILGGCSTSSLYEPSAEARTGTVYSSTLRQIESLNMERAAPILIRIYKEESTLEIWKQDRTSRFVLLNTYPICKYSGTLGPKIVEGDRQAPEGFYDIRSDQLNPNSSEYLAFNIGFPNAFDRSLGRTGSFLMVHGGCRSVGCYAMTDNAMEEIYGLVYEAFRGGQEGIQLQAFPFRMTAENLARHAEDPNAPFWEMLKVGNDAFTVAGFPPAVVVCDRRYVFNPVVTADIDPTASCPPGIEPNRVSIVETRLPSVLPSRNLAPAPPATRTLKMGTFCHTQGGRFGPGQPQPLGSSCVANAPSGQLAGQIGL
jgi:murein L,D-transpeptidase YafK